MKDDLLKILFAEDVETDFELATRTLKKGNINFTSKVVDSKENFENALETFSPDIIISDYSMPGFDGMTALKLAKKFDPKIPFIILTGSMNEETAVSCMKEGANDYVIKELITRLPYAVHEALSNKKTLLEKERVEHELIKSEKKYRRFFEEDLSGVYLAKPDGALIDCNPAFVSIFGFKNKEEAINTSTNKLFESLQQKDNFIKLIKKKKNLVYHEQKYLTINNEPIYVIENAIGIFDANGKLEKIQGYIFNITELKILQNELIKAKEEAEKANYLKTEFLAQMSHEIRTPINAILNSANFIKEETYQYGNKEVHEFFPVIDSASKRIIRTIDSILNMSELQIGSYIPKFKKVDLHNEIIENLYIEFKSIAISRGLKLDLKSESKDTTITVDPYSVEQIFTNLIDNAVKYTEKGFIEINIYRNKSKKLCVDVSDSGIGISKSFISQLFEPFSQEQQGYTRRFEGNGLGLALVKNYCKINNAEINVQSKKGKGTTFTVIFEGK